LLMTTDKTLHTEREVEMYLKLPVLVSVPALEALAARTIGPRFLKGPVRSGG